MFYAPRFSGCNESRLENRDQAIRHNPRCGTHQHEQNFSRTAWNCYHFQQGVQHTIRFLNAKHAKPSIIVAEAKVVGIASLRSRDCYGCYGLLVHQLARHLNDLQSVKISSCLSRLKFNRPKLPRSIVSRASPKGFARTAVSQHVLALKHSSESQKLSNPNPAISEVTLSANL